MNLCDNCIHRKVCRKEVPNDTSCNDYINVDLLDRSIDYLFDVIEDEHWGRAGKEYSYIKEVLGFDFYSVTLLKSNT